VQSVFWLQDFDTLSNDQYVSLWYDYIDPAALRFGIRACKPLTENNFDHSESRVQTVYKRHNEHKEI
jgi:hypothetical protein